MKSNLTAPAILLENISLIYHHNNSQQVLLQNLNAAFPAGQISCILGKSGVGKTSLLRLIAHLIDLEKPAEFTGNIIDSKGKSLVGQVAYMMKNDSLLPWLTAIDNVLIGKKLRSKTTPLDIEKGIALLEATGLKDAHNKYPFQLSEGMKQRVSLARTLMEDKPVILMDEPFSALDTITRLKLQELTVELLNKRTVIMVTHDPAEALRMGHCIFILQNRSLSLEVSLSLQSPPCRAVDNAELSSLKTALIQQLLTTAEKE